MILLLLGFVAVAYAQAPSSEYLPPLSDAADASASSNSAALTDDGYRYKTVRKLRKYRHRRDVSQEYLPPSEEYLPPLKEAAPLADDGYRYKTVRKLKKYRHRRDVSELPSAEYLPPAEEAEGTEVGKNGYKYKTVRKLRRYRTHRH